jgi:GAF domain-containing protein
MTRSPDPSRPLDASAAFEELGRIALDEHSMESVLQRVAELARDVVPGAAEVSVSLVSNSRAETVVHTGALAQELDETQYETGYGPCLEAALGGQPRIIADARTETRWPAYTPRAVEHGSLSSMSVPIPVQRHVSAGLNIYGRQVGAFDEHGVELATTFASYAAVALSNMHLYETNKRLAEQLAEAMHSRAVIDQAKGILMGQRRCDAGQAFELLVDLSQRSNRKLRDVAQALVDAAAQPEPPPRA